MKILLIFLMFFGAASSCEQTVQQQEITAADLENQLADINSYIASFKCSTDSGCSYIAYGSKACGGPQDYLIFSNKVNIEELKTKVDKYTKDEATYNKQQDIMSDCSIPPAPTNLKCEDGNCIRIE
jgi:hypothetical protein